MIEAVKRLVRISELTCAAMTGVHLILAVISISSGAFEFAAAGVFGTIVFSCTWFACARVLRLSEQSAKKQRKHHAN